jgi:hypothetical protein
MSRMAGYIDIDRWECPIGRIGEDDTGSVILSTTQRQDVMRSAGLSKLNARFFLPVCDEKIWFDGFFLTESRKIVFRD